MPRHKYLGQTIKDTKCGEDYVETRMTFVDYANSPKTESIKKPAMQGSLEEIRVNSMVEEYLYNPRLFRCKDKILIADFNGNWFIIDGQHRLSMIEELYDKHNKFEDNHKFTFCWFKVKSQKELESLFISLNKDSIKNEYYISQEETERIRITSFMELFKHHYNKYFCKKKSNSFKSRIYCIEEVREKLLNIDFFKNNDKSEFDLFKMLKDKNDEFFEINRYAIEFINNETIFYEDEKKKIKDEIIISLKNNNFFEWLKDPNNNTPIHKKKFIKKKISKKMRGQVWRKEYGANTNTGVCPIPNCHKNLCCETIGGWHVGHVVSEYSGGQTMLDNLRPICPGCNLDMGTENWNDYVSKSHLF